MTNFDKALQAARTMISTDVTDHYDHEVENECERDDDVTTIYAPYCHTCDMWLDAPEADEDTFMDEREEGARGEY